MNLGEPWQYEFFRNGIAAATLAGMLCSIVGVYVVLRHMSYIGHGLSHAIFGGAVVSYVSGVNYYLGSGLWGVASALLIGRVSKRRQIGADAAIGIVTTASFAIGVALISRGNRFNQNFEAVLFGNVLAVNQAQVVVLAVTAVICCLAILALYRQLMFMTFDPEVAPVYGIKVGLVDGVFTLILAATIIATMQVLGVTLIAAALVVPPVIARMLSDSFKSVLILSTVAGAISGFVGMYASYFLNIASGPTIVLTAASLFGLTYLFSSLRRLVRRRRRGGPSAPHRSTSRWLAATVAVAMACGIGAVGCKQREAGEPEKPLVVTSIWPLGSLIRNVAGARAQVETLTPYGRPHTARTIGEGDRNLARYAKIGFFAGFGYDDALAGELREVVRADVPIVFLSQEAITPEALISYRSPDGSTDVINPFTWVNPVMGLAFADRIRLELSRVDPEGAKEYDQNFQKVASALLRIDEAVSETISTIPSARRALFAQVNAFDYLSQRYSLRAGKSVQVFTGQGPTGLSPSGASPEEMAAAVRDSGANAVFSTGPEVSAELEEVAKKSEARSVGLLRYEFLPGPPGSLSYTYFGMLIDNARNLAGHLGGSTSPLEDVRPNDVATT